MTREEMIDVAVRKVIFRSRVRPYQTARRILGRAAEMSPAEIERRFRDRVPYPGYEEADRLFEEAEREGRPLPVWDWGEWAQLRGPEEYPFIGLPYRLRAIREMFRLLAEAERPRKRGRPWKEGPVSAATERKRRQRARQRGGA